MSFEELGEPGTATQFETISVSDESTVVSEWVSTGSTNGPGGSANEATYQSEAELEAALIKQLEGQAYERLTITSSVALVANLRTQLEVLNKFEFTDAEWKGFFEIIAGANEGIVEKTARIQEDHVQVLKRDDGTSKNVYLIDKQNIHNNRLQVINQYEVAGAYKNRYDVTILVNGLPMVHVELKRRGVDIREAFNQINRYQRDSFWADSGLFNYVQLFVISNGTLTKYYSNTTAAAAHAELSGAKPAKRRTSNSFEFTSWWADESNKPITGLTGFTATFFAKHTLLNLLTKYCVFDVDRKLLVMRPYQIVAAEKILQRIETSTNYKKTGSLAAGGYVWHTTGSGKTLTSFKAAQLASKLPHVDKVMFVVDRKDLDYQTMREYNRFEKDSVNGSKNTAELKRQLEKSSARIVVTTIQKLVRFIEANKGHEIYGGHIVLIFDECHRSQFGDMHTAITKAFKNYHLFGFTGTPIFAENAGTSGNVNLRTTEQAFGERLHTYTIVHAINDKNVLPFRIDYVNTIKVPDGLTDKQVAAIDTERALLAPERLSQVVSYIREHFDQKTRRNSTYTLGEKRVAGFNSIFATASITAAKLYYEEFRKQQVELPAAQRLKVGLIYSFAVNEAEDDSSGFLGEEDFETGALDGSSRDFLESAIKDYNGTFGTSFGTSADKFQNYYKDLSLRLKNRELDMVIVVNMFLTGFDATTLNTLWVDKNLRSHGLIQAYSRTNRILNSVKTYGTIVSFRDLEEATNDALTLFGNKDARGVVILKPYDEYYGEYEKQVGELLRRFPLDDAPYVGEANQKAFIALFSAILRLRNILTSFDEFAGHELINPRDFQDFQSVYLNLYADWRGSRGAERESINDDVVFEIELIKQVEVNVDYILTLVQAFRDAIGNSDKELDALMTIQRAVDSSPSLRNKKDLILQFVDSVSVTGNTGEDWKIFVNAKRDADLDTLIADEALKADETKTFVANAFRDGAVPTAGTAITRILPPASRFAPGGEHGVKKQRVLDRLEEFFDRYFGLT
ncbi:type I restriction endonuclease subunit R [Nocardioides eburneiflavus]|uniref:Type I restriction enzyme endonuclease subunit n=1 Tax=Nocardioides eburneiflavus TaxID=2518372 RepID=A0A4Z1CM26_9ACTN|nr:type I restriction endonuclease subunit R [Nocardioides eburneiflavus]TGN63199.1 type I restriction endonuclease subunit R [Nocardioides eburneiflavus]